MDPALLEDRVFRNMMDTEDCYISDNNYFENVQKEIKPHMRKLVTDWMLKVDTEKIELSTSFYSRVKLLCLKRQSI